MHADESPLNLPQAPWSHQKEVVRLFYKEMWDHANTALVPEIFHSDFTFRGSLGSQLVGHAQFVGYVEHVTGALDRYTSDILAIAEEGSQVFQAPVPRLPPTRTLRCSAIGPSCMVARHADVYLRWTAGS